nr:hypothetical protein [Flaviramulus sp.]
MNLKITLLTLFLTITFFSCKKEKTFTDYKYSDQPVVFDCPDINNKLYDEALYSFEDDILNFYGKNNPDASLILAYSNFIRNAIFGKIEYEEIVSNHSYKILEALKNEKVLWDSNSSVSRLNYKSDLMNCIASNVNQKDLKTTLNALLSTNSMTPKLFGRPLINKYRNVVVDKHLASYVAFDLYYARLYDLDLTEIDFDKPEPNLDFNVILPEE